MDKLVGVENLVALGLKQKYAGDLDQLSYAVESLDQTVSKLKETYISQEDLMGIFRGLGDTALGMAKTITSLITKGGNRSELRMWCDKNSFRVDALESTPTSEAVKVFVDVPTGMTTTYKSVLDAIVAFHETLDIDEVANECRGTCDSVLISMTRGSDEHIGIIASASKALELKITASTHILNKLNKQFDESRSSLVKEKFARVFASTEEMKGVRGGLLAIEQRVTSLTDLQKRLENADQSIKLAIDYIEKTSITDKISKPFVLSLATYVRNVGVAAEQYSICTTKQLALEHNLILSYEALQSAKDKTNG